ncbi:MAG TPA: response regulator transcription factor [Acidisarcina sp.]
MRQSPETEDGDTMKILIAGEEPALSLFLKRGLEMDGYEVHCLDAAAAPLEAIPQAIIEGVASQSPDLLIMDLPSGTELPSGIDLSSGTGVPSCGHMPFQTDFEHIIARVRSIDEGLPILVLSASQEADSRFRCLDRGADDCMIKPLSLKELRARCRVLLRRPHGPHVVLRWDGVELDRVSHRVQHEGRPVVLTRKEYAVLEYLMIHRGSCVSRVALLARVWSDGNRAGSNIVDVYINYLRRKLVKTDQPSMIRTVRGLGYRLGEGKSNRLV